MTATVSDRHPYEAPPVERPSVFDLQVTVAGGAVLARVRGPMDLHYTAQVVEGLEGFIRAHSRVVIDLRSSDYVDSTGIRALLGMHKNLEAVRGELRLVVQPGSRVERVIRLLQLERHFAIYANLADARAAETSSGSRQGGT